VRPKAQTRTRGPARSEHADRCVAHGCNCYICGVSTLRKELRAIVDRLIATSEASRQVSLDALGQAIGVQSISYAEIDAMISALEARGRRVEAASGGRGEEYLRLVVPAVRSLSSELGRRPSPSEISLRTRLSLEQVRHALLLARIMQR
jgi:hypothetical protein